MAVKDEYKKALQRSIMERLISALKNAELSVAEYHKVADFVLERFETLGTYREGALALERLVRRWPLFANVYEEHAKTFYTLSSVMDEPRP